ncbi:protein-associating with the carboxyl-terminal domain of ezrin isoform X2 [Agrilus planipennis]|uniref:Protein-associating with the carboxyl-terminal domain of ezrin isoform X2 n=1 Tax=Agrilus planipennis TaxID=224129 RepID=A0A1W4WGW1_AGRPL|nr:protein-associating with the carboxyl-terminal domain of ezrin isoform X2 [Agrilus planipennis]
MGNEQSYLFDVDINENVVEHCKYWSLHSAVNQPVSVFVGRRLPITFSDGSQFLIEKSAKNLMVFRHPCILKYISSWYRYSKFYLVVEEVVPLASVLNTQNCLQKCIGLLSLLKAVCFLHEKGGVSHNNLSIKSIYVTKDGDWKLGGMEFCCKFSNLTADYLNKIENLQHITVDINLVKSFQQTDKYKECLDSFAFGLLAYEILSNEGEDELSHLSSFRDLCKNNLQNEDLTQRPKLSTLLEHPFFKNDFVIVYSTLYELPLQSNEAKEVFFSTLYEKLKLFDEILTAKQLGRLLLSRLVLLDETAQKKLLPFILYPRNDEHFRGFMNCFSKDELKHQVLPELLLGIKDINNELVSATLRSLADMVQILGAEVVIGGRRAKLFNDGKPHSMESKIAHSKTRFLPSVVANTEPDISLTSNQSVLENSLDVFDPLPERPRPDGEENDLSVENQTLLPKEDLNSWDDWNQINHVEDPPLENEQLNVNENEVQNSESKTTEKSENYTKKMDRSLPDIFQLDIKNQVAIENYNDLNLFEGMEPEINVSKVLLFPEANEPNLEITSKKLDFSVNLDTDNTVGWDDDDWNK